MKITQAPEIFQRPIASIDMTGLPERGSPGFEQALIDGYALEYASKGWSALVTVDHEFVRVVAIPERDTDPKRYALALLEQRSFEDARPVLEALYRMLDDAESAYNYGVCLNELLRVEESIGPLERCVQLHKSHASARVALGVTYARLGRHADAERALRLAIRQIPMNAYAKRSLAAVLACSGKRQEALHFFRQAASLAPTDAGALLGLAECLDHLGGDYRKEAEKLYAQIVQRFGEHAVADIATKARNRIHNEQRQASAQSRIRMDAAFYMRSAIDQLAGKSKQEIERIVGEIARLLQQGIESDNPYVRYALKTLPGDFSALQLLSIMHVAIRLADPDADTGTGLDREYALAVAAHAKK